jgi:hypothetical protein
MRSELPWRNFKALRIYCHERNPPLDNKFLGGPKNHTALPETVLLFDTLFISLKESSSRDVFVAIRSGSYRPVAHCDNLAAEIGSDRLAGSEVHITRFIPAAGK